MDDIIVIILTLIFIVASIFGQRKKRKPVSETEAETAEAETQSSGENFWDMLNEEWKEATQTDSPAQQKPVETREQPYAKSQPDTIHSEKEGTRILAQKPKRKKETVKKIKKKKFPLRDAVIYSEILNRKYN
jgi:hypothetical protein